MRCRKHSVAQRTMLQLRLNYSVGPIARAPFLMCHGNNDYLGFALQVEDVKREPRKNELAGPMIGQWILRRSLDDSGDGIVDAVGECGRA